MGRLFDFTLNTKALASSSDVGSAGTRDPWGLRAESVHALSHLDRTGRLIQYFTAHLLDSMPLINYVFEYVYKYYYHIWTTFM